MKHSAALVLTMVFTVLCSGCNTKQTMSTSDDVYQITYRLNKSSVQRVASILGDKPPVIEQGKGFTVMSSNEVDLIFRDTKNPNRRRFISCRWGVHTAPVRLGPESQWDCFVRSSGRWRFNLFVGTLDTTNQSRSEEIVLDLDELLIQQSKATIEAGRKQ